MIKRRAALNGVKVPRRIQQLLAKKKTVRLDIGCGAHKNAPDCVGIDIRPLPGVDIVHDIEEPPWPLPGDVARVAFMSHVFEHLTPRKVFPFMAELHRVMEHDGQVLISGPYGVEFRFVQDPTHQRPINEATFCYWDRLHPSGLWEVYEPPVFHLESFEVFPAGRSRDFAAILRVCKKASCQHVVVQP
jgi:hypothetical protein